MREYVTDALMLASTSQDRGSRRAELFTRELGRIVAHAAGGGKILSKFAPHLDPLSLVTVRLAHVHRYTVTDALVRDRFTAVRERSVRLGAILELFSLVRQLTRTEEPDPRLFQYLLGVCRGGSLHPHLFLDLLGHNPNGANCFSCGGKHIASFSLAEQVFWCAPCRTQFPKHRVLLLRTDSVRERIRSTVHASA